MVEYVYPEPTEYAESIAARQYALKDPEGRPAEDIAGIYARVAHHVARAEVLDTFKSFNGAYPTWYQSFEGRRAGLLDLEGFDQQFADPTYTVHQNNRMFWESRFKDLLLRRGFVPGGRINSGAGTSFGQMQNCFSASTLVQTEKGAFQIADLEGETVRILSQDGVYREAEFRSFGTQPLLEVTLENGYTFRATPDHEWITLEDEGRVHTKDLAGKRLPLVSGAKRPAKNHEFRAGVRHGVVFGDGSRTRRGSTVHLVGEKRCLDEYFSGFARFTEQEVLGAIYVDLIHGQYKDLPRESSSDSYLYGFFCGLLATLGGAGTSGGAIRHLEEGVLDAVRDLAARFGIATRPKAITFERRGYAEERSVVYTLPLIRETLLEEDFLLPSERDLFRNTSMEDLFGPSVPSLRVESVTDLNVLEPVYCCTEMETHTMVVGPSVLTGQCFVVQSSGRYIPGAEDPDSIAGIYEVTYKKAEITKTGGGTGTCLSHIREKGARVDGSSGVSSGPVSFLRRAYNNTLDVIKLGGTRRGAGMATLHIDHPDYLDFLTAKDFDRTTVEGRIDAYNLSFNISDAFMQLVAEDGFHLAVSRKDGRKGVAPTPVFGKYHLPGEAPTAVTDTLDMRGTGEPTSKEMPLYYRDAGQYPLTSAWMRVVDYPATREMEKWMTLEYAVPARWLWREIASHAWATGDPGVLFIDRINEFNPMREYLGEIEATNPCLTGDTRILTVNGPRRFDELAEAGEDVLVYAVNRETNEPFVRWMRAPRLTQHNAEVLEVEFDSGLKVRATPDHNFISRRGDKVRAQDLKPGDSVAAFSVSRNAGGYASISRTIRGGVPGQTHARLAHRLVAQAMGWDISEGRVVHHIDKNQLNNDPSNLQVLSGHAEHNLLHYPEKKDRLTTKGYTYSEESRAQISMSLKEWFAENGTEHLQGERVERISVPCGHCRTPMQMTEAERQARLGGTVTNTGRLYCSIACMNRGRPSTRTFSEEDAVRWGMHFVDTLGKIPSTQDWRKYKTEEMPSHEAVREFFGSWGAFRERMEQEMVVNHKVVAVRPAGHADVYNGTVDDVHTYVVVDPQPTREHHLYTGIISANCGEEPLYPSESCCLGSMILPTYVVAGRLGEPYFDFAAFRDDVRTAVRFLDDVLTMNVHPLAETQEMCDSLRRIGLGVLGDADMCIKMGVGYASEEGLALREKVAKALREAALQESEYLAQTKGAFPLCEKSTLAAPRRNVFLLSIAPTGSISMIVDASSGIEPIFALNMKRKVGDTYTDKLHPLFEEYLRAKRPDINLDDASRFVERRVKIGVDGEKNPIFGVERMPAVLAAILDNHGSIRGLDEHFSFEEQELWVTAHDVTPEQHVAVQMAWQNAMDVYEDMCAASLSKTTNLPDSAAVEDVEMVYDLAFQGRLKGITIYRDGSRADQPLSASAEKVAEAVEAEEVSQAEEQLSLPLQGAVPEGYRPRREMEVSGKTYKAEFRDAAGDTRKVYVTTNVNAEGYPVEVFVRDRSEHGEIDSYAQALGILISLALKFGVSPEVLAEKLIGIRSDAISYSGGLFQSVPDLVGKRLYAAYEAFTYRDEGAAPTFHVGVSPGTVTPAALVEEVKKSVARATSAQCCDSPDLQHRGGCIYCMNCGYSPRCK